MCREAVKKKNVVQWWWVALKTSAVKDVKGGKKTTNHCLRSILC